MSFDEFIQLVDKIQHVEHQTPENFVKCIKFLTDFNFILASAQINQKMSMRRQLERLQKKVARLARAAT